MRYMAAMEPYVLAVTEGHIKDASNTIPHQRSFLSVAQHRWENYVV